MQQIGQFRHWLGERFAPSERDGRKLRARAARNDTRLARIWRMFVWAGTGWRAAVALVLFFTSASVYGAVLGGQFSVLSEIASRYSGGVASSVGLAAQNVSISGLRLSTREDIFEIIGIEEGDSIVGFDARKARKRLEKQDWIASASILRQFPNTLHIEIVERVPFALWQDEGEFQVIDKSGKTLSRFAVRDHLELPVVVGKGAEKKAHRLINQLEVWSGVKSQMRAAVRVADRRWNLYFTSGAKVLLPEEDVERALGDLDRLRRDHDVLDRAVEVIDLRSPERTVLRLSQEVAEARRAEMAKVSRR